MNTKTENPRELKMPAVLLESERGYAKLMKCDVIDGELISKKTLKIWSKGDESIYTGEPPTVLEVETALIPYRRKLIFFKHYPKVARLRLYHKLFDEPMTRDLYSYSFLNPEKKRRVLIEKGIIDDEGFLLEEVVQEVDGINITKTQRKKILNVFVKPDVSEIDFIKAEFHAKHQSKGTTKLGEAMNKTGKEQDKWFYITILGALIFAFLVVFVMSGGL